MAPEGKTLDCNAWHLFYPRYFDDEGTVPIRLRCQHVDLRRGRYEPAQSIDQRGRAKRPGAEVWRVVKAENQNPQSVSPQQIRVDNRD